MAVQRKVQNVSATAPPRLSFNMKVGAQEAQKRNFLSTKIGGYEASRSSFGIDIGKKICRKINSVSKSCELPRTPRSSYVASATHNVKVGCAMPVMYE